MGESGPSDNVPGFHLTEQCSARQIPEPGRTRFRRQQPRPLMIDGRMNEMPWMMQRRYEWLRGDCVPHACCLIVARGEDSAASAVEGGADDGIVVTHRRGEKGGGVRSPDSGGGVA